MKKQKQQVISRFFAPKSLTNSSSSSPSSSSKPSPPPPPKITATVTFPKASKLHEHPSQSLPSKKPKLAHRPSVTATPPSPNPSLHQKFLQKFLHVQKQQPSPSQTPLLHPPRVVKYTPLEQQVLELKKKYPDVLLMIEVGYRYRFFEADAEIAARVLGIYAHVDHHFLTASVPTFRLNVHVRRLVSQGYKVGVVKQTETAAIKAHGSNRLGPFCRGLSALYTKATLEAASDVGENEGCGDASNYLICVVERPVVVESSADCRFDVTIAIVAVEISTGVVVHSEFNDNFMRSGLEAVILSLAPAELLLGEPLSKQTEKLLLAYAGPISNARVEHVSRDCFKDGSDLAEVMSLFEDTLKCDNHEPSFVVSELKNNHPVLEGITNMSDLGIQALVLTTRHLKQFGFERILCLGASFRPFSSNMEMTLSANALQQLEVLKNNFDGSDPGSLIHCMNHTLTTFGSRLMRHWVTHPLCNRNMIIARLDAVSEIAETMSPTRFCGNDSDMGLVNNKHNNNLLSSVLIALGRSPDVQRGITRIYHRTSTASEFIAVIHAILHAGKQLQQFQIVEDINKEKQANYPRSFLLRNLVLTASSSNIIGIAAKLLSSLNKTAADQRDLRNLFVISTGHYAEVATARTAVLLAEETADSLITIYRKQLGIHDLQFLSVSGTTHLIELPVDNKVPSNWVKINSTKKTICYHPPEVVSALEQLSLAKEELYVVCQSTWERFLEEFSNYYAEFQGTVQALAALDCLHSLAILARNKNYVRPTFVDDEEAVQIHIHSGRHPVLDAILQENFVPNDTDLHGDREFCQIVTGPNMGGKSCYIRQVALITIMAQVGSYVPASSVTLHVLDGIYTRMGASDNIQKGRSTFLEELSEASHIIHNCTDHSLVIIDELGRGTSTHDGVAIAYATLYHLLEQKKSMTLFVTHYPKIADIRNEFPGSVGAYHVSYLTSNRFLNSSDDPMAENMEYEDITYLYKLVQGISESSFGLKVAQLAQLPISCIRLARDMAERFESVVESSRKGKPVKMLTPGAKLDGEKLESNSKTSNLGGVSCAEAKDLLEEMNDSFRQFFSTLKSAFLEKESADGFRILLHMRNLVKELMSGKLHSLI